MQEVARYLKLSPASPLMFYILMQLQSNCIASAHKTPALQRKEKEKNDCTFLHHFKEKPSIVPDVIVNFANICCANCMMLFGLR